MRRRLLLLAGGGVVILLLIQLVPYGRDHVNPPVSGEPDWNSTRSEELARAACYDCHSNETEWPWYSNIAPMSWLQQSDVDRGREDLNFSEMDREQDKLEDVAETVADGEMPPFRYTMVHPEARLSEAQMQELIDGFVATFGPEIDRD